MVELTVVPIGVGTSLSAYVAACNELLSNVKGVSYQLTPMGTIIVGRLEDVLDLARKMHEIPFGMGVQRVVTTIKIDDRRDREVTLESKVESVVKKVRRR
ncbi:MAG: MTH1187 family thiamine-binding protein [Chloroflexi bacterium]|nr:MTH1187 family thiamine-binding protein [Chloroflexota bacterium]